MLCVCHFDLIIDIVFIHCIYFSLVYLALCCQIAEMESFSLICDIFSMSVIVYYVWSNSSGVYGYQIQFLRRNMMRNRSKRSLKLCFYYQLKRSTRLKTSGCRRHEEVRRWWDNNTPSAVTVAVAPINCHHIDSIMTNVI